MNPSFRADGRRLLAVALCATLLHLGAQPLRAEQADSGAVRIAAELGVTGGLCVQLGAEPTSVAAQLAASGRFLVQLLDADEQIVNQAREELQASGLYGLVSVDLLPKEGGLPLTDNLVNLLAVSPRGAESFSATEAARVLCPDGVLLLTGKKVTADQLTAAGLKITRQIDDGTGWLVAKKPRPVEMDEWTHPRHSAAGNAASADTLVAPPRRVRWVVGAMAEVRGMVTAGGKNFYAGVLARDGFNGLRLWQRNLKAPSTSDSFTMKNLGGADAPPVAGGDRLYVVQEKKLVALNAATGEKVQEYPDAATPRKVLFDHGTLIATNAEAVRALNAQTGSLEWTVPATDPRYVVAGDGTVAFLHGQPKRGQAIEAVVVDTSTGQIRWKRDDLPWLPMVKRTVYHRGLLAFEVSTFNNDGAGNALHLLSANDGEVQLDYPFLPGMNHNRQARAMFVEDRLWLLHGGRDENNKKLPVQVSGIDFKTGKTLVTHPAGLTHCFPQVMTSRYMISGEFDLTDLETGKTDARQITKAACGPDGGWVPANGLIYVTPKHCVCWPMLRGYTALAPERAAGSVAEMDLGPDSFLLEKSADPPGQSSENSGKDDWPSYRHDAWRSGSTLSDAPSELNTLWSVNLGGKDLTGPIVQDWRENPFVKGPVTSPVISGDRVIVARPDAHEVVAIDADSGSVAWRFTANGRVDTTPTLHRGLCLFGTKSGWVYCLRADDGRIVWRLRAAPLDERLVAYGQLESPWPVPGSVLVIDDVAYFAAGRQSLADGGILIFAVQPASGKIQWVQRLDSLPQQGFYECSGLEFDNFDLLHRQGNGVGMSRWVFERSSGKMSLERWAAFAKLNTGGGAAMVPQGCWSYAPRQQKRIPSHAHRRPLLVFRDNVLFGGLQGASTLYRRDFALDDGEKFETKWMTGWAAGGLSRDGKMPWRSHRLAEKAAWQVDVFGEKTNDPSIDALVLAGDRIFVAGSNGDLRVLSTADGKEIAKQTLPAPTWDGMAIAHGRLFYTTQDGQLLCLGK